MDQASTYRSESDVKKESNHLPGRDNLERVVSIEGCERGGKKTTSAMALMDWSVWRHWGS